VNATSLRAERRSLAPLLLLFGTTAALTGAVAAGTGRRGVLFLSVCLIVASFAAVARPAASIRWRTLIATLILIILFIPMRRYSLPGSLPFQLEPYRIFVFLVVIGWAASLLVDARMSFRRTGFDAPILVIVAGVVGSEIANPGRVAGLSSDVAKSLTFFVSFVLVLYLISSVLRRLEDVDYLVKRLVFGGGVVAFFAIIEARTGFNVFNHLSRVIPILHGGEIGGPAFRRLGSAHLRVFGSAEHPIALSAALVMLIPLAGYLWRRYRQRRWALFLLLLAAASASTVSRTGIVMLVVVALVFVWLRPAEMRRLSPALLPVLIAIHFVVPGTLGAIKESFLPKGGLVAEQKAGANTGGSGRLADLGPGLTKWQAQPLLGEGFGTQIVNPNRPGIEANIFDDQWLGTLLAVGAVGLFGWIWFFTRVIRRLAREAKRDDSDRGWLLVSIAASVAAFAVGMTTFDAFAFIQVTFLLFILVGLASALLAERPTPLAVRIERDEGLS
jgi:polysaccharide biosynthesis protein PslJ